MSTIVCEAIRTRSRISFRYEGLERVVEPYCHGVTKTGAEAVRAIQVRGESSAGRAGLGFGKLWRLDKIQGLRLLAEPFVPDDPHYNPADSAMATIHCHV